MVAFVIVPIMFMFSSCALYYATEANSKKMPDVQAEVTINNNIRFFTTNFLTVWFGGSDRIDTEQLQSMVTDGVPIDLPVEPMTADFINVDSVSTLASGAGKGLYQVTANVTLTAPGSQETTRNKYVLEVARAGANYAVAKLPEITQYGSQRVESRMNLAAEVSTSGPLGEAITNFASAYYVSSNAASLGRFVTSGFKGEPIQDSPYTAIQIDRIQASKPLENNGGTGGLKDGDTATVLVTFRGVVTNTTFNLMQTLLDVTKQDGKWVVAGIDKRVPIEGIQTRESGAATTTQNPLGGYTTPTMTDSQTAPDDTGDSSSETSSAVSTTRSGSSESE
ncbi:hypothetical protein [Gordonia sihwensis]|uniref:hypothetical protein n=1 Tax=Gordonia sihwensis TaxID=173559 RepID=UPI003D99142E